MLTVRHALEIPALTRAGLLAGASGLDRRISAVTGIDVPDFMPWLRGHEFLLMTGYAFRDQEEALADLIADLARLEVAALGIKFKRYLDKLPQRAKEIADQVGLPVISIPYESSWADVINPIMTEIINRQAQQLERSDRIRRRLIEQVFNRGGLPGIARQLSEFVHNQVTIVDLGANTAFHTVEPGWPPPPDLKPLARYYTAGDGELLHHLQSLPLMIRISGGDHPRVVVPVDAAQATTGYIVVWESNCALGPSDMVALEQGTMVAALEIEQLEAGRKATRQFRHDFLRRVLSGELPHYNVARLLAGEVGWTLGEDYQVAALEPTPRVARQEVTRLVAWEVKDYLLRNAGRSLRSDTAFGLDADQRLVLLLPGSGDGGAAQRAPMERAVASLLLLTQEADPGYTLTVGVGRFYAGYIGLRSSYAEAVSALQLGVEIYGSGSVTYFKELGIYRMLNRATQGPELEAFFTETIGPLLAHDQSGDLLRTLQVFLQSGGNHRLTAKRLFLHHNTVRYRIRSIEQLCRVDLKNETDRLNLSVGLKLIPLLRPGAKVLV